MKHKFHILDSVWTQINGETAQLINNHLSFQRKIYTGGRRDKGAKFDFETVRMIDSYGEDKYLFPTGLLNRAILAIGDFNEEYEVTGNCDPIEFDEPHLENVVFRDYQKKLINAGLTYGRGVLKAPTATGKSIIILGIISAFSQENILFLCHTKDLVIQMKEHLEKNGFTDIGEWTGNAKEIKRITVATIQSYAKVCKKYAYHWNVIIIDEGHHVSTIGGQYAEALTYSAAPVKLAVTATMPYIPEAKMALEAFIGPIIGEYTIKEANEDGFLAVPKIKIIKVPDVPDHILMNKSDFTGKKEPELYPLVYWNGIVKNVNRNLRILQEAYALQKEGKSVLISLIRKEHGSILMDLIKDHYKFKAYFVHGVTLDRNSILKEFRDKTIKVVIATVVFNEGVDIPNLDCCINASGGRTEIGTLQKIGRGLRKTKDKSSVLIIDFHDTCHPMLENQFKERMKMYVKNGWVSK